MKLTLNQKAIYPPGLVEFYFDTARTVMDLTISQTIQNFTKLRYAVSQEGGSFPSIEDRFLISFPALEVSSKQIYNTRRVSRNALSSKSQSSTDRYVHRFWYDSAGPVFYSQVKGLLGYGVPTSQLTFGTVSEDRTSLVLTVAVLTSSLQDYPYSPMLSYAGSIEAITDATFITATEKQDLFRSNAEVLYGQKFE